MSDHDEGFDPYGTTEGQTASISEYLAEVIRDHGHEAYAVDIKGSGVPEPDDHDALERLPSAFFSVSLAAHDKAEGYIEKFVEETGWRPGMVGLFGGALLSTSSATRATRTPTPRATTCIRAGRA